MSKPAATWLGAQALRKDVAGEGLVGERRELRVEGQDVQAVHAEVGQHAPELVRRQQSERFRPPAGTSGGDAARS